MKIKCGAFDLISLTTVLSAPSK